MPETLVAKNTFAGERPIFYDTLGRHGFDARELVSDTRRRMVSRDALYDFFLYRTVLPPHALDDGLNTLFPGEELWRDGKALIRRNPDYNDLGRTKIRNEPVQYFVDRLDEILEELIARRVDGKKNIATTLSGGIDSAILASYLPKSAKVITWGGWGENASDIGLAKLNARALGLDKHQIFIAFDFDKDEKLYHDTVPKAYAPFMFSGGVAYLRMCERLREEFFGEPFLLMMGQNADTIAAAFHATVWMSVFLKTSKATRFIPFTKEFLYKHRKFHPLTTSNPVEMAAFFQSSGTYPGPWVDVPREYFDSHESELIRGIGHRPRTLNDAILMEELLTEARRNQLIQNMLPPLFGASVIAPFFEKEVIRLFLEMPIRIRAKNGFNKFVLHELARKRGLPQEVLDSKIKRGLAYNYKKFVAEGRHLPIWDEIEKDPILAETFDIPLLRKKWEGNYLTMDPLRSLQQFMRVHGFIGVR